MWAFAKTTILTLNYYLRRFLEGFDELEDRMSVDKKAVTFEKATEVRQVDSHTYEVNLEDDWCIGSGKSLFYDIPVFTFPAVKIPND